MTTNITEESSISKKNYFNNLSEKLCYLKFHQKDYWGIFKSIEKKFPSTPPLLINYHFVTNFNEKKCSLISTRKFSLNRALITTSLLISVNMK